MFSNENIIYRTRNNQAKFISGKFACIIAIVAGIFHFNENPVFISILVFVLASMIIFFHEEELIVFEDKFSYRSGFALPGSRGKEFYYKDIKDVIYPVDYNVSGLVKNQLYKNNLDARDKIHILFKNGKNELLKIAIQDRIYVVQAVNKINDHIL